MGGGTGPGQGALGRSVAERHRICPATMRKGGTECLSTKLVR